MLRTFAPLAVVALLACGPGNSSQTGTAGGGAPAPQTPPGADGTSSTPSAGGTSNGAGGGVFVGGAPVAPGSGGTVGAQGGASGGQGSGGGGAGAQTGGGAQAGAASGAQASGGQTLWSHKMGGLGVEYTHDVAVAPDGSVVAFNLVGVRGESLEQIGFVHMDGSGNEFESEFENESGAALHLAPSGAFAIAPLGTLVLAAAGRCGGGSCPTVGGKPLDGGAVVGLAARARAAWQSPAGGDVTSNVDVNGQGGVLIAAQGDGGLVDVYRPDGSAAWRRSGIGRTGPVAVSFDGSGGALVAVGGSVVRLDGDGAQTWQRVLGPDVVVTAVRAAGGGVLVHGHYRGALTVGGTTLQQPAGTARGWFLAQLGADGAPRWATDLGVVQETADDGPAKTLLAVRPDGVIVLVTGADACTAAVATFEAGGAPRWRRPVAVNGCGGTDLVVHGLAVTPSNRIVLGGAMSAAIDFGTGTLNALATDAFVVELAP